MKLFQLLIFPPPPFWLRVTCIRAFGSRIQMNTQNAFSLSVRVLDLKRRNYEVKKELS